MDNLQLKPNKLQSFTVNAQRLQFRGERKFLNI